jgi:hypothetical protein
VWVVVDNLELQLLSWETEALVENVFKRENVKPNTAWDLQDALNTSERGPNQNPGVWGTKVMHREESAEDPHRPDQGGNGGLGLMSLQESAPKPRLLQIFQGRG